jgi:hypothetical protein
MMKSSSKQFSALLRTLSSPILRVVARQGSLGGVSLLAAAVVSFFSVHVAHAGPSVTQPQMDLGQTSFLDGEAGQGGLLEVITDGTTAAYFTDANGRALEGQHKQWSGSVIVHPAYVSDVSVLGGYLGGEFLFPFAAVHLNVEGQSSTTQTGVGDMTFAPFIQWSDGQLMNRPFSIRLAMQFVAPTGTYSQNRQINMGQNAWQLSPYLAFTWRAAERWEVSGRMTYDWSGRNDRPISAMDAASSQAGDQFEMNLSASYAVAEDWRVELAGYALQQLSDAAIDGRAVLGSRQRDFGLGPGVMWSYGTTSVIGTAYREFETTDRPEGFQAVIRLLQPF